MFSMASVISAVCFLTLVQSLTASPPVVYMNGNCGTTINVPSSGRIKLDYTWPISNPCIVEFTGSNVYRPSAKDFLSARVLSVDIEPDYTNQCTHSRLDILDYNGQILSPSSGICGTSPPPTASYSSTGDLLQVQFQKYPTASRTASFEILITRFSNGFCVSEEFMCKGSLRCVSKSVTCDGFQDCPHDSDETLRSCSTAGIIAGITLAVVFAITFLILVIVVMYRRHKLGHVFGVLSGQDTASIKTTHCSADTQPAHPGEQQDPESNSEPTDTSPPQHSQPCPQ